MKQIYTITLLLLWISSSFAQVTTFQRTYRVLNTNSPAEAGQQTSDGGFVATGYVANGSGLNDFYMVKTASNGVFQWAKTFGNVGVQELSYSIQQTADGGYIIGADVFTGNIYLVKSSSNGTLEWAKSYGGAGGENVRCVQQTTDGGYIMAGSTDSFGTGVQDIYLVKVDTDGNIQWTKTYGGISTDMGNCIRQTSDGGYITCGTTFSFGSGSGDIYIVKTDAAGLLQWSKTIGGAGNDGGNSIQQTTDGGYVIGGNTSGFGAGNDDFYLVKITSSGNLEWANTFGGNALDRCNSVQQTLEGGYIMAGYTKSFGAGNEDTYLVKVDPNGTYQWSSAYGGPLSDDRAAAVQQTLDGGYLLASSLGGYCYLIKTDAIGTSGCNQTNATTISGSGGSALTPLTQVGNGGAILSSGGTSTTPFVVLQNICNPAGELTTKITSTTCGNSNGVITITGIGGAVSTYSFVIGGIYTSATPTAVGFAPGTYTVTAYSSFTVIASVTVTVDAIPIPTVNISATNASCNGVSNGMAVATVIGGTPTFTYAWSPSAALTATAKGLGAGIHTVTVSDFYGCIATQTVLITEPPAITGITSYTPATCGQPDGIAGLAVSGGTPGYTYNWSGKGTAAIPFPTINPSNNLKAGTYTVIVTDNNLCTKSFALFINNLGAPNVGIFNSSPPSCKGYSDGFAIVSAVGGTSPYSYNWNTNPAQTTLQADQLSAGNYDVTVTDANNCQSSASIQLQEPPGITAFLDPGNGLKNVSCNGGNDGKIKIIAFEAGNTLTYNWNTNPVQTADSAIDLTAGDYELTINDGSACIQTLTLTITEPAAINASINSNANCATANGKATAIVSGGTPPYTYSWSPVISNSYSIGGLSGGTYTCKITDAFNCTATVSISTNQGLIISPAPDITVLAGESTTIGVTGSSNAVTYQWSPALGLDCPTCASTLAKMESAGVRYCVRVTDTLTQCVDSACITIFVKIICDKPFVPTAFSPNGDNYNDVLLVTANCTYTVLFTIYNRWGEKVFEMADIKNGWDGSFKNKKLDPDVFVYYLQAIVNGESISQRGNITLIK